MESIYILRFENLKRSHLMAPILIKEFKKVPLFWQNLAAICIQYSERGPNRGTFFFVFVENGAIQAPAWLK